MALSIPSKIPPSGTCQLTIAHDDKARLKR